MEKQYYIDSFPYEVELTARLCHENAKRLLESLQKNFLLMNFLFWIR